MAIQASLSHDQQVEKLQREWKYPTRGKLDAPVVVLCEPPDIASAKQSMPMSMELMKMFARMASDAGMVQDDFVFVGLCPPVPLALANSESKKWGFVQYYQEGAINLIQHINPEFIVTMGKLPARVMSGRAMAVNKARGQFYQSKTMDASFFAMLSAKLVGMQPDYRPIMAADMSTLKRVKEAGWDRRVLDVSEADYHWTFDLQHLIDNPPAAISIDTETTGLQTQASDFKVLVVQITHAAGHTDVVRVCPDYFPDHPLFVNQTMGDIVRVRQQIKELCENPRITKILHNGKYDFKALRTMGIEMNDWWDTELMARFVNENFLQYNLDEMVRIYVPEMAGYADKFNETVDKGQMIKVPPEDVIDDQGKIVQYGMLSYAGGDSDATFRLAQALKPRLAADAPNLHVMNKIHRRALFALTKSMETYGFTIDEVALQEFQDGLEEWITEETRALIRMTPAAVRRHYLSDPKGFKFSRDDVMRDILFKPMDPAKKSLGFGLVPKVFTKGTMDDPDPTKRIPSVSTKDHLPYFITEKGVAGEFVVRYSELKKATKMLDTYARGFWKYIQTGHNGERKIIPEYNFRTNTKRSNSSNPNGQNFPKRGKFAKPFRRLFKASRGKVLVASDLSQAELRIAAWMANEPAMLQVYRDDGDIHATTAALTMGISVEEFYELDRSIKKTKRQGAKAVNFGLIYGAREQTFITYAKTTYNVDYTMKEATVIRDRYFDTYAGLLPWHERMRAEAAEFGAVRSLHGLTRHLHAMYSNDWSIKSGAERNAINSPVQNFGSDLGIIAFLRLASQADPHLIRPVGFIHDQLIAEVDENYVAEGMGWLRWVMENPPLEEWFGIRSPIPIKSDPEWGLNLADTTELADDEDMLQRVAPHVAKPDWWNDDEEEVWNAYRQSASVPPHVIRNLVTN
jgi:DNA polymerase I-like protein with 3'-5' exonuclease and polymerase domains